MDIIKRARKNWRIAYAARSIFEVIAITFFAFALVTVIFWYAIIAQAKVLSLCVAAGCVIVSVVCFGLSAYYNECSDKLYGQYQILSKAKRNYEKETLDAAFLGRRETGR